MLAIMLQVTLYDSQGRGSLVQCVSGMGSAMSLRDDAGLHAAVRGHDGKGRGCQVQCFQQHEHQQIQQGMVPAGLRHVTLYDTKLAGDGWCSELIQWQELLRMRAAA